jgi:hypothetical protein
MQIKALKVDKGAFCSKLASSGKMRKHMYLCKEKYLCQKQEHIGHCSHVRFELVFLNGIHPANQSFQGGEILFFFPNRLIQVT